MFGLVARTVPVIPRLAHTIATQTGLRVPPATQSIGTPAAFLKAIGRESETKVSIESWEEFWNTKGRGLKDAGVDVRDRRYILWCMEKYRRGVPISEFAHEPTPKKTIRGWGPSVQEGKRIRSRRLKGKKK